MYICMEVEEQRGVVIIGGGICGLATALALHRNGIASVILEKCKNLKATGAAIIVQPNGWRALDYLELGVASLLRRTSLPIHLGRYVSVYSGRQEAIPLGNGELRCVKRIDLIKSLEEQLPSGTLKLGCHVTSIKLEPITCRPILRLQDGNILKPQVVIGCDGVNSIVAKAVGLNPARTSSMRVIRGLTSYENGHGMDNEFVMFGKDGVQLGRMTINEKQVYWFITRRQAAEDSTISKDPMLIKQSSVKCLNGFPEQERDMVTQSDIATLHLTDLKYRAPWDLVMTNFRRGTMVVAGDAMHAMGPFLAQGGSAALEDAVVLSRCLLLAADKKNRRHNMVLGLHRQLMSTISRNQQQQYSTRGIRPSPSSLLQWTSEALEEALSEFVRQRKRRVLRLSTQTYLIGLLLQSSSSSTVTKFAIGLVIAIIFRDGAGHTNYDCTRLSQG